MSSEADSLFFKIFSSCLFRSLTRLSSIKDPIVRYSILIEIIHTALDSAVNIIREKIEDTHDTMLEKITNLELEIESGNNEEIESGNNEEIESGNNEEIESGNNEETERGLINNFFYFLRYNFSLQFFFKFNFLIDNFGDLRDI